MSLIKPPLYFTNRGNLTFKFIPTQELQDENTSNFSFFTPNNILLAIFGSAYALSFLANLRVIHIVYSRLSNRIKTRFSVSVLVAHLALICIGITTLSALDTCKSEHLLNILGSRACEASEFLKDSIICAFSLNTLLLVYKRVRTISHFDESLLVFRIIGLVWSLSCTQGFFTMALAYHMKLHMPEFKLGAQIAGISCEVVRFIIFHFGVVTYITYALVKVHSKLSQLPMPCKKLKAKMENIRFFYIHFCIFVIVWITYGLGYATQRCAFFLEFDLEQHSELLDYAQLGFYTYLTLNPMIHLHLLDNEITTCPKRYMCIKGHFKRDQHFEEVTATEKMDDERHTTVGITSPGAIEDGQGVKSSGCCTMVRVISSSPIKYGRHHNNPPPQMYVQKVHFVDTLDIEYIDAESDTGSSSDEGEYEIDEKQSQVRFADTDDVAYYVEDHLDDSEEKTSGESDTFDLEAMETAL